MSDHKIEWLDDPGGSEPVTPPRRSTPNRTTIIVVAAAVAVVAGVVIAKNVSHAHRQTAIARSSSAAALGTPTLAPPVSTTPPVTETLPTPTQTAAPVDLAAPLKSCASLARTSSASWLAAVGAVNGGCTLDGKTAANFSILPCNAKTWLYTTTASGTWYWGETGEVLHSEAANASPDTFIDAYRHCVGFNTTRCLTADQALALISRGSPGSMELEPDPSTGYKCVDGWAFINVRHVPGGNGGTDVLHVEHDEWIEGDRVLGCGDGVHPPTMPAAIRMGGCGD
jgi:hypothetical protein